MILDFHLHTTASDGRLTPAELVALAHRCGVDALAITDHDSTEGVRAAQLAAAELGGPRVIPGVEINTEVEGGEVHILGLFVDPDDAVLQERLRALRDGRVDRGRRMLEKLAELGMPLDWERVAARAGGAIGRPHVAEALVEAGYVPSIQAAFETWLGYGRPAYVERTRMTPEEAVRLLRESGAVPVLAHPMYAPDPERLIARLVPAGLLGLEVYYGRADAATRAHFLAIAQQLGLIASGGSDYHGIYGDNEVLPGAAGVPAATLAALEQAAARWRAERAAPA